MFGITLSISPPHLLNPSTILHFYKQHLSPLTMASTGMSSEETSEPIEDEPVWHPAHEHLDETDTTTDPDYQPSPSGDERRFGVLDEWGGIEEYADPPYPDPPDDLDDLEEDDDDYLGAERFIRADPNDPTCTSMCLPFFFLLFVFEILVE